MSNEIDKKLFKQIFDHALIKLADKLINTANKEEENWIIVKNINKNQEKLYEQDETDPFHDRVIQPNSRSYDLIDAIKLILDFNETIQLDWFKNIKIKNERGILIGGKHSKTINYFM